MSDRKLTKPGLTTLAPWRSQAEREPVWERIPLAASGNGGRTYFCLTPSLHPHLQLAFKEKPCQHGLVNVFTLELEPLTRPPLSLFASLLQRKPDPPSWLLG